MRHYRARVWCASLCVAPPLRGEGGGDIIAPRRPRENWLRRDATRRGVMVILVGRRPPTGPCTQPPRAATESWRETVLPELGPLLWQGAQMERSMHAAVARAVQWKAGCGWAALQGAQRGRHVGTSASPRRPLARKHSLLCTHARTHAHTHTHTHTHARTHARTHAHTHRLPS